MVSKYAINKGINNPVEFRGLKGQWIWWMAGSVGGLLLLFMILYVTGLNSFLAVIIVFVLGGFCAARIYSMSAKYGEHGMMKESAARKVPKVLTSINRQVFLSCCERQDKCIVP